MQECSYSCLVCLLTGKSLQILAPPAPPGLLRDYEAVTSMSSKTKYFWDGNNVKDLISITIIFPLRFSVGKYF